MEQLSVLTGVPRVKRKREEEVESNQSAGEGPCRVSRPEAPAAKRRKRTGEKPKMKTQGQEKAPEPGAAQETRKRKRKECGLCAEEIPAPKKIKTKPDFFSRYVIGDKLGEGGFGSVYEGRRSSDGLKVAIKFLPKLENDRHFQRSEKSKPVPIEVALMRMVSRRPACKNIIKLIEWYEEPDEYILIMERPDASVDLKKFIKSRGNVLDEETARVIMLQTVEAASQCAKRGVLHRDIKPGNLLINTETSEVKLIDFGCGDLVNPNGYTFFAGTRSYSPPECFLLDRYHAHPTTVWSLGVLLYRMVCGYLPFDDEVDALLGIKCIYRECVSEECRDLIDWCLHTVPEAAPRFTWSSSGNMSGSSAPSRPKISLGREARRTSSKP